jgi:hypothetical protein
MTVGAAMTVTVAQWQRSFYALTLVSRSKPVSFFFYTNLTTSFCINKGKLLMIYLRRNYLLLVVANDVFR